MTPLFLTNIRLKQFRSFASLDLDLPASPGVLIVQGTNGLGKSSLFDGIEWALTDQIDHFRNASNKPKAAEYLCRWYGSKTETFSELGFSDGSTIKRSLASEKAKTSVLGGTVDDITAFLRSPDWEQKIESLDHYLLLTHFLGQSVLSRLTHRDPANRFEILREAAQNDAPLKIVNALHGHTSSLPALTYGRQIAERRREADALSEDLDQEEHLWAESRTVGAVSEADAAAQVATFAERLQSSAAVPSHQAVTNIEQLQALVEAMDADARAAETRVEEARLLLSERDRASEQKTKADAALGALDRQHQISEADLSVSQARQTELAMQIEKHQTVQSDRVGRATQLQTLVATIALRDQLDQNLAARRLETESLKDELKNADRKLRQIERQEQITKRLITEVESLDDRAASARRFVQQMDEVVEIEMRLVQLRITEAALERDNPGLADALALREAEAIDADARMQLHVKTLASLRDTVGGMSAAVTSVVANLSQDACDCPVCATHFLTAGELHKRAGDAARRLAPLLFDQEKLAAEATAEKERTAAERDRLRAVALEQHRVRSSIENEQSRRANILATTASPSRPFEAMQARADALEDIDDLLRSRARKMRWIGHPWLGGSNRQPALSRATRERDAIVRSSDSLVRDLADISGQLDRTRDNIVTQCSAAFNLPEVATTVLEAALSQSSADVASGEATLAAMRAELTEVDAEIRRLTAAVASTRQEITSFTVRRDEAEATLARIGQDWRDLERFGESPDPEILNTAEHRTVRIYGALTEASAALARLREGRAAWGRQVAHRNLLEQLRQRINAAPNSDRDTIRSSAMGKRSNLLDEIAGLERAHKIAKETFGEVSTRLSDFNTEYIKPLGKLMKQINVAILRDRTIGIDLKVKNKRVEQRALVKDLDPILVHSEGQLAALAVSLLCAASLTFPWSRWNALVLDDPLQSNDTIHAAAFADLISNLVNERGYQVMISTHLQSQAEFLDRKFRANGVNCSTVSLLGIGDDGVEYEVRSRDGVSPVQISA
jgi:exonuclease SbcC